MNPALHVKEEPVIDAIHDLVRLTGGDPESFDGRLVTQMVQTSLRMIRDKHDTGQLKLMNASLKEMWYAFRVFNQYLDTRKISIFGSARTPEDHPDYLTAREFSRLMAHAGWMCITGAGDGIMKAGHEGPQRERSFGLSIRLPFETTANDVIENDPKLINFRYFFTRKLMFMSHAHAVAVFPGGFGTQDELFESLVLVQTGKSNLIPIVLIEGEPGVYWNHWEKYIRHNLLKSGWISSEDVDIYHIASTPQEAAEHILRFYSTYHSSRYVDDWLVMRLQRRLSDAQVDRLNDEFGGLVKDGGRIEQRMAFEGEENHIHLPRIAFRHTKHHYGMVRRMIDRINDFGAEAASTAA